MKDLAGILTHIVIQDPGAPEFQDFLSPIFRTFAFLKFKTDKNDL